MQVDMYNGREMVVVCCSCFVFHISTILSKISKLCAKFLVQSSIIKPHCSAQHKPRPTVTAAAWSVFWSVCLSVCWSVTTVLIAQTAELIKMSLGRVNSCGPGNKVKSTRWEPRCSHWKGQFWGRWEPRCPYWKGQFWGETWACQRLPTVLNLIH